MALLEATPTLLPLQLSSSYLSTNTIIALSVFFTLLCACIIIGHLLEENRWANESIVSLILGLCSGVVVLLVTKFNSSRLLAFNEDLFFLYLLPPIIFNAGFQVKKKQFFKNFTTILLFGIFGTVISFCLISFEYRFIREYFPTTFLGAFVLIRTIGITNLTIKDFLAVGAILSATDSVCTLQVLSQDETPFLYSIVFGEGVINDATSIVLFNSVQSLDFSSINAITALKLLGTFLYLFCFSTALGIAEKCFLFYFVFFNSPIFTLLALLGSAITAGLLSAFIIKKLYFGRHSTDREVALMMLMAYLSYMIAELLNISGILTIFFCGVVMSHYTWHNVTESSRVTTKHSFATISFIAETFIFLYVGMDALDIDKWKTSSASAGTSLAVSSILFALVLIGRAAFVFPIAIISNCIKTKESAKIQFRSQFIIWWAGLMRGAVTIALSYTQFAKAKKTSATQDYALMITSTIIVVLFSTMVFGSITKPLIDSVQLRHPKPATNSDSTDNLEDLRSLFLEYGSPSEQGNNSERGRGRSSFRLLISYPTTTVHYYWRKFDDKFMRPVFGGRGFVPFVPGSPSDAAARDTT